MKRGMNSSEMQRQNRSLVLKTLIDNGGATRTGLAESLGLQKATITNIINEFLEMGIIQTVGEKASGRRGETISLKNGDFHIMSIGITRKDWRIGVFHLDGVQIEEAGHRFSKGESLKDVIWELKKDALAFQEKYHKENCLGVCVSVPGPFYVKKEENIELFQVSEFESLNEMNLRNEIESVLGMPVTMVHDAKLAAYAEWKNLPDNAGSREKSLMVIRSRGFGIGGGIVINGKILEGQLGIAGEIGHVGINYNSYRHKDEKQGTFEYNAGTESAVRYMHDLLFDFPDSVLTEESKYDEIVAAYQSGDKLATIAINKMAGMLAFGIVNFIYTINPDLIIIGQDYPKNFEFIEQVKSVLSKFVHPIVMKNMDIRYSELNYDSFLVGGYYHIINELYKNDLLIESLCRR